MLLGEFRKKTETLDDKTVLVMFAEDEENELGFPVNTLDLDRDQNGELILTLTDGKQGTYSL